MGELTASAVMAANVSILAHTLGKAPESNGEFLMQNRIIGEVNASQVTTCADSRCKGTLRPPGCICTKGAEAGKGSNGAYLMEAKSDQIHTVWQTPCVWQTPWHAHCTAMRCARDHALFLRELSA